MFIPFAGRFYPILPLAESPYQIGLSANPSCGYRTSTQAALLASTGIRRKADLLKATAAVAVVTQWLHATQSSNHHE